MVVELATPPLSPDQRAILATLLDPTANLDAIDPLALAAALKNPAILEAIEAHEFARSLRIQHKLAAATSRAIEVLASILDSCDDPRELRLAANAIARFAQRSSRPGGTSFQPMMPQPPRTPASNGAPTISDRASTPDYRSRIPAHQPPAPAPIKPPAIAPSSLPASPAHPLTSSTPPSAAPRVRTLQSPIRNPQSAIAPIPVAIDTS